MDATGRISNQLPGVGKRIMYYSAVLPGQGRGNLPIPAVEMFSSSHSTAFIRFWLESFLQAVYRSTSLRLRRVEVDFSYALLHSISQATNKMGFIPYLERCYSLLVNELPTPKTMTIIHVCSAHAMKAVTNSISGMVCDRSVKELFGFVFARMIDCVTLKQVEEIFHHLATLL
ncbi:MAG: hypothetical protein AAFO91_10355, partial [Bacteroidota bacterium]